MRYALEQAVEDLVQVMKDNLNAEIIKTNIEKNEVPGSARYIPEIPFDSYIFSALDETTLNFKSFFVVYDINEVPVSAAQYGNSLNSFFLSFEVATFDELNKDRYNTLFKLLRYQQAIQAVLMENQDVFRGYATAKMASLKPNSFVLAKDATLLKCGIEVTASITGY